MVYLYFATLALTIIAQLWLIDSGLRRERQSKGSGNNLLTLLFIIAHWAIAAFDPWSIVSVSTQLIAYGVMVCGLALNTWAMAVNPWFSSVVRLQHDRGQRVVTDGPYKFLRHPGNLGSILVYSASGIVLGSPLATLIGLIGSAFMVHRIAGEDAMLKQGLWGYRHYAAKVRWRVIPGIW